LATFSRFRFTGCGVIVLCHFSHAFFMRNKPQSQAARNHAPRDVAPKHLNVRYSIDSSTPESLPHIREALMKIQTEVTLWSVRLLRNKALKDLLGMSNMLRSTHAAQTADSIHPCRWRTPKDATTQPYTASLLYIIVTIWHKPIVSSPRPSTVVPPRSGY